MKTDTTKNLKDLIVAFISTPESDGSNIDLLLEKDAKEVIETFHHWMKMISRINSRILLRNLSLLDHNTAIFALVKPIKTQVGIICQSAKDQNLDLEKRIEYLTQQGAEFIFYLSYDQSKEEEFIEASKKENVLPINIHWLTSIVIENSKPFFAQLGETDAYEWTPYIQKKVNNLVSLQVNDELTKEQEEINHVLKNYKGDILTAESYLPTITLPMSTIIRFYTEKGYSDAEIKKVVSLREEEIKTWKSHINNYNRYHIIAIDSLKEYLMNPKYFDMELTIDEVMEQLSNLLAISRYSNYNLCLTEEVIELSYEIKHPTIILRTNFRKKSMPKIGSISNIIFSDGVISDKFENEFWDIYNAASEKNKEKSYILKYVSDLMQSTFEHEFSIT
ncbi:hypothetical protein [Aquimarina aquimarini]|uniref:hypothetical protein n=1 Tax=Aquimarina aquimarini TaxID=1191734 RepID=UPI000D553303|nr:hypothetical protein [Aquimarina aquimarini]